MFPFWNTVLAPVLEAAGVRRLVEIGALRGENTEQIIDRLGPQTELHVIDPVPDFDPAELGARFGGQYVFHRDLSLNVLPNLEPMDAALIDGDHNWYTVYNELRILREVARANDAPLPLLILHDVGWPYGQRDLYYEPEDIPAEFRHPWRRAGMRPGQSDLIANGGLNPRMCNAEHEGGPRNGVRCGLDDFLAEHDREFRLVVIPIYFGLAIVAETERLERQPALKAELDRIQGVKGKSQLLHLAEQVRIKAMLLQHHVYYGRDDKLERAVARQLDLLKATLLHEQYLEDEARLAHYNERIAAGRPVETRMLRDPIRHNPEVWGALRRQRLGPAGPDPRGGSFVPHTDMGRHRLDHLHACLDRVVAEEVPGDLVEVGCGRGGGAIFLRGYLDAHELGGRRVYVADRFRSSEEPRKAPNLPTNGVAGFQADLNLVRDAFDRYGLLDGRVRFLLGPASEALADERIEQVSLARIGRTAADEALDAVGLLAERIAPRGHLIVEGGDEHTWGEVEAVLAARGWTDAPTSVDEHTRAWQAPATVEIGRALPEPRRDQGGAVVVDDESDHGEVDLSIVVIFYNMRREAARTLRSLSRAYQEGIDGLRYEVIVVDNGSAPTQRLDAEFVAGFGPEFRFIDMGADATPSPVPALNVGIRAGVGRAFALMIDGAHVLTPGVLRHGMLGLDSYAPAIVATQQWYTGPGQQGDAMDDGYDQGYEDRLFSQIGWPQAGYRLFEIGHFVGDRDWLDGVWESNCLFVPRAQLEQVGGFEERFDVAGGGYANLELYERLGTSPDVTVVSILGEGSFHQVHGGTTTNQVDAAERRARVFGYSQEYAQLRGRAFQGPGKPIHYVGRITTPSARRTKARRLSAKTFLDSGAPGGIDGPPTTPTPVPEDLRREFVDATWRSMPWEHTSWLAEPTTTAPSDLLAYQEMISQVRPDWIVETGGIDPGRTAFLASMCDLVGHGQVISVAPEDAPSAPEHPRVQRCTGRPHDDATAEAVRAMVGDSGALVVLGSRTERHKTALEFEAYAPLVGVGSYVVVADTVVNGNPVWTGFGPGPAEAVKQVLTRHGEFVADPIMEKYSFSFNPNGYLRRVR